jgi:hypothetical protein
VLATDVAAAAAAAAVAAATTIIATAAAAAIMPDNVPIPVPVPVRANDTEGGREHVVAAAAGYAAADAVVGAHSGAVNCADADVDIACLPYDTPR